MTWDDFINEERKKDYFIKLNDFIENEYLNKSIMPPKENIFRAFDLTPIDSVKVVIIGQDPYPTKGVANGLAFSVNEDIEVPKSLKNIYKELNSEGEFVIPSHGNLTSWAKNGVFLINRILTVEEGLPLSHKNVGWEIFVTNAIKLLNKQDQKIVFILLGNEAIKFEKYLDNPHHLILKTSHPSPLGAYKGFFGSNIFMDTVKYLDKDYSFWKL